MSIPPINYRREIIGTGLSLLFFCAAMFGLAVIIEEPGERDAVEAVR